MRGSLRLFALVASPYLPLHHMEDRTRNIGYMIVKVQERLRKSPLINIGQKKRILKWLIQKNDEFSFRR